MNFQTSRKEANGSGSWSGYEGFRMQDAGCRIRDAGCGMRDAGCRMHDTCKVSHVTCLILLSFLFISFSAHSQSPTYDAQVARYIKTYSSIAVKEMSDYHIPASITLAQGIIESAAGQSTLAKNANNHFGIKCHKEWTGKTYFKTDDKQNECFRKYDYAEESFRDHSSFLTQRERYKSLFSLPLTDYHGWAEGLQAAGYATNRQYAGMLIKTIEDYHLDQYDNPGSISRAVADTSDADFKVYPWIGAFKVAGYAADGRRVYENNGIKCVVSVKSDNIFRLSSMLKIPVKKLMTYNDLKTTSSLAAGQPVYLKSKKRKASIDYHVARTGESLYEISQRYGLKMKLLLKRNGMSEGMSPYAGQVLKLR